MRSARRQFLEAPQIWVTIPESYMEKDNFVPLDAYGPSFEPEKGEIGMLLVGGKISQRIFYLDNPLSSLGSM